MRGSRRYHFEVAALRVLRPLGIAFFVVITVFPFYYMVLLFYLKFFGDRERQP